MNVLTPDWPIPDNIHAFYTSRLTGHSLKPFNKGNLGHHVGDCRIAVQNNRQQLAETIALPNEPLWLTQTHSTIVYDAKSQQNPIHADACYSQTPGLVCTILTADCLPILVCNKSGTEVAAIHAGWRGLAGHIINQTLEHFCSRPEAILAWIGPGISAAAYEVDSTIMRAFQRQDHSSTEYFQPSQPGHFLADLAAIAKNQLHQAGIKEVYLSQICTYNDKRFFS